NECAEVLDLIGQLYGIERRATAGPPEDRARLRQSESQEIVKRIEKWALSIRALPGSSLRNAIEYMGGMWENGLLRFLDDPNVPIDMTAPSVACAASSSVARITTALAHNAARKSPRSSTA